MSLKSYIGVKVTLKLIQYFYKKSLTISSTFNSLRALLTCFFIANTYFKVIRFVLLVTTVTSKV